MSLRTNDQRFIQAPDTEVRITQRYVALAAKHNVKLTLYVCGKCFTEEWEDLRPIGLSDLVEIGGHGYRARQPRPLFDWYGRQTGNWNGPRWYQEWDIRRMVEACKGSGVDSPVSWRAHSYKVDSHTYPLLSKYGLKLVSDEIRSQNLWPERINSKLISHPINTLPDHDHLYHAHRDRQFVDRANAAGYGGDEFGVVSYGIEKWGDLVVRQIEAIENKKGISTVLAHPVCMYLADKFQTFERVLQVISQLDSIWASQMLDLVDAGKKRPVSPC